MKDEITKAIDKMIADGWISVNTNLTKESVVNIILEATLSLSFQDFKKWYLK